jgi:hypothetical protein
MQHHGARPASSMDHSSNHLAGVPKQSDHLQFSSSTVELRRVKMNETGDMEMGVTSGTSAVADVSIPMAHCGSKIARESSLQSMSVCSLLYC